MICQGVPLVSASLLTGKMGMIVTMFITSLLILLFGFMAIRLRQGILNAMGEISSNLIQRFTASNSSGGGGSMSANLSATGSGGGGDNFSGTVGTAVSSVANGAGSTLGRNLVLGAAGVGAVGVGGKLLSGKSDEHSSVATGDGDVYGETSVENKLFRYDKNS